MASQQINHPSWIPEGKIHISKSLSKMFNVLFVTFSIYWMQYGPDCFHCLILRTATSGQDCFCTQSCSMNPIFIQFTNFNSNLPKITKSASAVNLKYLKYLNNISEYFNRFTSATGQNCFYTTMSTASFIM